MSTTKTLQVGTSGRQKQVDVLAAVASGVTAGTYTNANITVDQYGLITAAGNGSGGGGSGGAPDTSHYVLTQSDAGLLNGLVIPGLAAHADVSGAGVSGGIDEEYNTTTTGLTWSNTPAVVDSNTTVPSHLYVKSTDATVAERTGTRSWSPSGDFDARCKLAYGIDANTGTLGVDFIIGDSTLTNRVMIEFSPGAGTSNLTSNIVTYHSTSGNSAYSSHGQLQSGGVTEAYLRITRVGTLFTYYYSSNGILWRFLGSVTLSMTVAKIGYRIAMSTAQNVYLISDWLRTNV